MKPIAFLLLFTSCAFGQAPSTRMNLQTEKLVGNVAYVEESVFGVDPNDSTQLVPIEDRPNQPNRTLRFDRKGNLVLLETGGLMYTTATEYRFYRNGLVKKSSTLYPENPDRAFTDRFFYNKAGQLERLRSGSQGTNFTETTYRYDRYWRVIYEEVHYLTARADSTDYTKTFTPDSNGLLVVDFFINNHKGPLFHTGTVTFDSLGRKIHQCQFMQDGDSLLCYNYEYDTQGNLTRTKGCDVPAAYETRTYDERGLPLTEKVVREKFVRSSNHYERVFDEHGNWIVQRSYRSGRLFGEVHREIRYYP